MSPSRPNAGNEIDQRQLRGWALNSHYSRRYRDRRYSIRESRLASASSKSSYLETSMTHCDHIAQANWQIKPGGKVCRECARLGMTSIDLRVCLICGNVACCDSSSGRHATQHYQQTGHPVMRPRNGDWAWCYVHQRYLQSQPPPRASCGLGQLCSLIKQLWTSRMGSPTN